MRYYLIIDKDYQTANAVELVFEEIVAFKCLAILKTNTISLSKQLPFPPEIVIINLDSMHPNSFAMVKKINRTYGLTPKYIGITSSFEAGYHAFKKGFLDVLGPEEILSSLKVILHKYIITFPKKEVLCLKAHKDFQYVKLKDLLFLKADNNATDIYLKNGDKISVIKTLKHFAARLPINFLRVHRSYIVNAHAVTRINYLKKEIHLINSKEKIPFSKNFNLNIDEIKILIIAC